MASPRQVQNTLSKFRSQVDRANNAIEEILETVRDLEQTLKDFDSDEDLDITRGLKREIERGKDEIQDLRRNVDKLDRELSDTNRKFSNLAR